MRRFPLPLALLLAGMPFATALAQEAPLEVELGWRFVNVTGSENTYRSQGDERPGFLLRGLSYSLPASSQSGFLDSFRLDAHDIGAGPAGGVKLDAGKTGAWQLRLSYNRWDRFSAVNSLANPFLASGVVPGQHTQDRRQQMLDVELQLLPNHVITPFVGWTWNRLAGPGATTYHVGEDEFRLTSDLEDTENEIRFGANVDAGPVTATVSQGWRFFRGTDSLALAPGAGNGNRSDPVLGTDQSLTSFRRDSKTDVDTPVTNLAVNVHLADRITLLGTYVRAAASTDASDSESLAGSLVSFDIRRFFQGLSQGASAKADATFWRAAGRIEVNLAPGLDVGAGFLRRDRELDGLALVSSLFTGTTNFTGFDPKDIQQLLESRTTLDRTEDVFDVTAAWRRVGPFGFRVSWSQTDESLDLTEDPTQIVIPGAQGGSFDRRVRRFEAAATFATGPVVFGGQFRTEKADSAVLRTDFRDRERYRVNASFAPAGWIKVGAVYTETRDTNDDPAILGSGRFRDWNASLEITPAKPVVLRLAGGQFDADSSRLIQRPYDLGIEPSIYAETGNYFEAGATLTLPVVRFDASLSHYDNGGSFGFELRRAHAGIDVPIGKHFGAGFEWRFDSYREDDKRTLGDYDANRYGIFIRIAP